MNQFQPAQISATLFDSQSRKARRRSAGRSVREQIRPQLMPFALLSVDKLKQSLGGAIQGTAVISQQCRRFAPALQRFAG